MPTDSRTPTPNMTAIIMIVVLLLLLFGIWWFYPRGAAPATGGILNQPKPPGVPDILQKHEPPPTQP